MNKQILLYAMLAASAYLLLKKNPNIVNNVGAAVGGVSEIFTGAKAGDIGFGWRYFTDGTSISPEGTYYHNGVKVWG